MAQDAFRRQVRRRVRDDSVTPVTFYMEDEEGNEAGSDVFHFSRPTEEQLFLLAAGMGGEDSGPADEAAAVMAMIRQSLPSEDYKRLRARLMDPEDGLDMQTLTDTIFDLMEVWTDFPTKQPSVSAGSQASSGGRSTGRVRGAGSTRSNSPSRAS